MRPICVKVPDSLFLELETKAQKHETKLSNIVRECIRLGLGNIDAGAKKGKDNFHVRTYYLLEKYIQEKVEGGEAICKMANELALKVKEEEEKL